MKKQEVSKIKVEITLGFMYWIQEDRYSRGLEDLDIRKYPEKLAELKKEYNEKYPNGLTGWNPFMD